MDYNVVIHPACKSDREKITNLQKRRETKASREHENYSRLTGFDALLIDRVVYYKFRVIL